MSNITVTQEKLADANRLVKEVKEAFDTLIPPIRIEISNRADVNAFATVFKSAEHSYHGKRISCKNAKSFAPSTYAAVEIYTLENNKFPIELLFKSFQDIEDFADGYLRAVETVPAPVEHIPEPTPAQLEEAGEAEEKGNLERNTASRENRRILRRDSYDVNPFAETLLDTILKVELAIGWILAVGSILASVFLATEMKHYYFIILGLFAAAIILLTYYSGWAIIKVFINMSRSLYNINEKLKENE